MSFRAVVAYFILKTCYVFFRRYYSFLELTGEEFAPLPPSGDVLDLPFIKFGRVSRAVFEMFCYIHHYLSSLTETNRWDKADLYLFGKLVHFRRANHTFRSIHEYCCCCTSAAVISYSVKRCCVRFTHFLDLLRASAPSSSVSSESITLSAIHRLPESPAAIPVSKPCTATSASATSVMQTQQAPVQDVQSGQNQIQVCFKHCYCMLW